LENLGESFAWTYDEDASDADDDEGGGGIVRPSYSGDVGSGRFLNVDM